MDWNSELGTLLHIGLAALLGGIVGMEREWHHKAAGLRTHMFVSAGAALFVYAARIASLKFMESLGDKIEVDPIRVLQAIIIGVSFIGAGTIIQLHDEGKVQNLTTAASIFFVTGVGVVTALEQYITAVGLAFLGVLINWGVNVFERKAFKNESDDKTKAPREEEPSRSQP
ncbi:MAG: MgtC/SapB family protein [Sumerlaeia bacterium]